MNISIIARRRNTTHARERPKGMRARTAINLFFNVALGAQILAGGLVVMLGALQKADLDKFQATINPPVWLAGWLASIKDNGWWILPVVSIFAGFIGLLRKMLGSPWLCTYVQPLLNIMAKSAFNVKETDGEHYHRVTLFKHVPWLWCCRRWPWNGWLVAVERSGHTSQSGISYFRAPDNADQAEGIAGTTWARNKVVTISNLPDLRASPTDADFEVYSTATFVGVERLRESLPGSRAFCGIPIEVKGRLWGVLVLDSRSPDGIQQDGKLMYTPVSKLLGKVLEKL
jgi:hypothetical protein